MTQLKTEKYVPELLEIIQAHPEEWGLPATLSRRLVMAGWVHQDGNSEMRFRELLEMIMGFEGHTQKTLDLVAAITLSVVVVDR